MSTRGDNVKRRSWPPARTSGISRSGVLSLYPDFSQVEAAVTDINFSYTQKYVPDNRPFFAEGSAYFGRNPAYFYSNAVPNFDFGAKFFARTEGYQVGALPSARRTR